MITVIIRFYISLTDYLLGIKSNYLLAFSKLVSTSFDVKEIDRYNYKIIFASFKKVLNTPIHPALELVSSDYVIYDLSSNTQELRKSYLSNLDVKYANSQFVAGNDLAYFKTKLQKIIFILLIVPAQIILAIYGLRKKDKSGLSSIFINLLKTINFIALLKRSNNNNVVLFSIYDTNSAFLSQNLIRKKIHVSSVTSEVPLYKWNQIIITNELILCHDYQHLEVKQFSETILYNSIAAGKPEQYYNVEQFYNEPQSKNSNLAFLSTGGWVRNKLGHIDQGTNMEEKENEILISLNTILAKLTHINLVIYPHPRELKYYNNNIDELKSHYKTSLKDIPFTINEVKLPTNKLFNDCYTAICYMTTLIFERSFANRKSAIVYYTDDGFPLPYDSKFLAFISNEQELEKYLLTTYK